MANQFSYPSNTGSFVATTNVWDPTQIHATDLDPQLKEILVRMYQNLNLMATNVNLKETGYYNLQEFVNGNLWFPNPATNSSAPGNASFRQEFIKVVNFGPLPNAGTKTVAHNIPITVGYTFTMIYGTATNPNTEFIPIPYSSTVAVADNIEIWVDPTNVNIRTAANYSAYTTTYVVMKYIKS